MSKNHFLRGTLILTCTGLFSRFIGFFYRIFLSHTIGAQGLGIYQLALPLQTIVLAVTASGMQMSISRICASLAAVKKEKEARDHFILGTAFSFIFSFLLSVFIYRHAAFFATEILKEPRTLPLIRLLSASFPLSAVHSCINSYYYSQKRTGLPSCLQLLEQICRVGSSYLVYLVFLSEGREITPLIAAAGALFSEIAAAAASLTAIGLQFRSCRYRLREATAPLAALKTMFSSGLPHSLNRLLLTLLGSMEVILIPQRLRMAGAGVGEALGIYGVFTGMALPLILFPATIPTSAAVMLMPSVAELKALGQKKRLTYVIGSTCRFCFLFGAACTLFFFVLGKPLGLFLFQSPTAGIYIKTLAFICPFLYMNTALTSILNGLGRPGTCLFHSVCEISVRIAFVLLALPAIGIRGYFYGLLLGELLLSLLHLSSVFRMEYIWKYEKNKKKPEKERDSV